MSERMTLHKWFWAWDFDKEEQWLNSMAQSGWTLDDVGFTRFGFIRTQPSEYIVRLELRPVNDDGYCAFMEEVGAEYIGRVTRWVYFRRKSGMGSFDLFSDLDSRIAHMNRICGMGFGVGAFNIGIGLMNMPRLGGISLINLAVGAFVLYGAARLNRKRKSLAAERKLHE